MIQTKKERKPNIVHLFWTQQPSYCAEGTVRGVGGRSEEDLGSNQGCEQLQRLDWRFPLMDRLYSLKVRLSTCISFDGMIVFPQM